MNTTKTVAKNASVLMISQLVTWGLSMLLTLFLPRYLGVAAVGKFHLARSLWAIGLLFADFGMEILLTKEIARKPDKIRVYFGTSIIIRGCFFIVSVIGLLIYSQTVGYSDETLIVIIIIGIASFFSLISLVPDASLRALERMEFVAIGHIVSKLALTTLSIALLLLGYGLVPVATVTIISSVTNLIIQLYYLRRLSPLSLQFSSSLAKWMLKSSFTYLTIEIFLVLYLQIDIVIISLLVSEEGVGWYGAADQLLGTLLFIPNVIMMAVFPALSRMHANESKSLPYVMRRSFNLLLLIGVPAGLGLLLVANQLVVLLFGQAFAKSGPILSIMGVMLILTYQNTLLGRFLVSVDRQKAWTKVMAVAVAATILLDLVLVPWCEATFSNGAMGGAIAFVITELGMLIVGLRLIPQGTFSRVDQVQAIKIVLSGLLMIALTWWFRDMFIAIPVIIGAITYLFFVFVLKVIQQEEWDLYKEVGAVFLNRFWNRSAQHIG